MNRPRQVPLSPVAPPAELVAELHDAVDRGARVLSVRHFGAATGTTPHQWLLDQRLQAAEHLLEVSDLPVDEVARRAGFGSPETRHHFAARRRTSPQGYRRTFGGGTGQGSQRPSAGKVS